MLCPLTSIKKVTNYSERASQLVICLRLSHLQSTKCFFVWQILVYNLDINIYKKLSIFLGPDIIVCQNINSFKICI